MVEASDAQPSTLSINIDGHSQFSSSSSKDIRLPIMKIPPSIDQILVNQDIHEIPLYK